MIGIVISIYYLLPVDIQIVSKLITRDMTTLDIQHLVGKYYNTSLRYKPGEHIYSEGEHFRYVYYILDGKIKLLKGGYKKQMTMWHAEPNEFVGIMPFFENSSTYDSTAIAIVSEVKLVPISKEVFLDFITSYPEIQKEIINELCQKLNLTEMRITTSVHHRIRAKFIDTVVMLAEQYYQKKIKGYPKVSLTCSLEDLTKSSGIPKEYLKKLITEFQHNKLLKIQGINLIIDDFEMFSSTR